MRGAAQTIERTVKRGAHGSDSTTDGGLAELFRCGAASHTSFGVRHAVRRVERALLGRAPDPTHVGRYAIDELVGAGGAGVVYRALDPRLARWVALKLLRPQCGSDGGRIDQRLLAEARALASVEHENVVEVYDVGLFDDHGTPRIFLVMEWIDGCDLATWGREKRSSHERLEAYIAACRGLAAVHACGVVHRDFKPANVLRDRNGVVKVADFGLASPLSPREVDDTSDALDADTTQSLCGGTPRYMAPEQHDGLRLDARADQYSFCVALFEALYGEPPFRGDRFLGLAERKRLGPPAFPRGCGVSSAVAKVLERGLQPDPEQRFPSMVELADALERCLRSERRRSPIRIGAAVVTLLGLLGALPDPLPQPEDEVGASATPDASIDVDAVSRAEQIAELGQSEQASAMLESIFFSAVEVDDARTSAAAAMALVGLSYERGLFDDALRWSQHARSHLDSLEPVPAGRRVAWLHNTAMAHFWAGEIDQAQRLLAEADVWLGEPGLSSEVRATVHGSHGTVLLFAGEPALALQEHARELAIRGDDDPGLVSTYLNEGNALDAQGREHAAWEAFATAESIALQHGREDVDAISATLSRVRVEARLDPHASLPFEAAGAIERLADAAPAHRAAAAVVAAEVIRLVDGCEAAIDPSKHAVAELEAAVGAEHHAVGMSYAELGITLRECGQRSESRRAFDRSLEILRVALPSEHPWLADVAAEREER